MCEVERRGNDLEVRQNNWENDGEMEMKVVELLHGFLDQKDLMNGFLLTSCEGGIKVLKIITNHGLTLKGACLVRFLLSKEKRERAHQP